MTIVYIVGMVPVWVPLCMVAGLIFDVPVGTLSVMIGRYFYRVPIRESLFDGDAFAYRFMWRTSTRTDSWHSDSPRRLSCLTTETGTMAFLAVASGGTSDSVHRQCEGHSCVATETDLPAGSIHVSPRPVLTVQEQTVLPRHSLSQVRHISPFPIASTDPLPSKCHEVCTENP